MSRHPKHHTCQYLGQKTVGKDETRIALDNFEIAQMASGKKVWLIDDRWSTDDRSEAAIRDFEKAEKTKNGRFSQEQLERFVDRYCCEYDFPDYEERMW